MRSISAGKRQLELGGDDDLVCRLDVCDEVNEYSSDVYVNDCEGDYTDEIVTPQNVCVKTPEELRAYPSLVDGETSTNVSIDRVDSTKSISRA